VNSKIFETELTSSRVNNRELIVKINPLYINILICSSISLSLLPMVGKPKNVECSGDYYPYFLNNTNLLALAECKVIKGKYDQRYETKVSKDFIAGINYINNVKFKINKVMLKLVYEEWVSNKDSLLFKGFNEAKIILSEDTKEIKRDKNSHNARYYAYYNIIHLAILFQNQTFYLPTYADFRGRVYTLSNYFSYQGMDLARALLLFDSEEVLTKKGLLSLNIYFTNLAGFDKLAWNDRLLKANETTLKFKEAFVDYFEKQSKEKLAKILSSVAEPFQYISIGLAKLDYMNAKKGDQFCKLSNPILFDASCSGIQHISALTLDTNLAKYSNVYTEKRNPSAEKPEDFYSYALDLINDKLLKNENPNIKNITLKRSSIKRTVMTIPYNISLMGVGEQLEQIFKKIWKINKYEFIVPLDLSLKGQSFAITTQEFGKLTKILFEVLTKEIPSLKKLTNYFKEIITVFNKLNLPIT
jgi:DNA-directed RNA polymerase